MYAIYMYMYMYVSCVTVVHVHSTSMCMCIHVLAVEVDQPPASTVRRFLALLEQSDIDFSEELGKVFRWIL